MNVKTLMISGMTFLSMMDLGGINAKASGVLLFPEYKNNTRLRATKTINNQEDLEVIKNIVNGILNKNDMNNEYCNLRREKNYSKAQIINYAEKYAQGMQTLTQLKIEWIKNTMGGYEYTLPVRRAPQ